MEAVSIANSPIISHNLSNQIISIQQHKNNYHCYNDDNKEEEEYKYQRDNNNHHHRYSHSHHHRSSHHKSSRYHSHSHSHKHKQCVNSENTRRGKKRKRNLNNDDITSDDTMSSQPIQPRKRRKKSMDDDDSKCSEEKNERKKSRSHHYHHRHRSHSDTVNGSSSSSSSSSTASSSASSDCSYYAKSKQRSKCKQTTKHFDQQNDDENDDETMEINQNHLSPSPSLSISSLNISKNIKSPSLSPTRSRSHRRSSYHSDSDSSIHSNSSHQSKRHKQSKNKKKKKRKTKHKYHHYEKSKPHNRTPQSSECDSLSDTDSDSSLMSSSSSASFRKSKRTKTKKRENRQCTLPTTRHLILSGCIKWDRLREEEIEREIKKIFCCDEIIVKFWKYSMQIGDISYCKHLNCISVSFETSKICKEYLRQFALGQIDFNPIGHNINLSMDQHKKRANKYYAKHVEEQRKVKKAIFGKKGFDDEKCNENEREMNRMSKCYSLPTAIEPLQSFDRPKMAKKENEKKPQKQQQQIVVKEPQTKKRKLTKMESANKKIIHLPKQKIKSPKFGPKIDKKKEVKIKNEVRINKLMKKEKKSAIIQSKKKLVQHSNSLKNAMIKVKTSKHHCKELKEKEKKSKKQMQIQQSKHSDFKTPKAVHSRIKNVSVQKLKKEKIIKTPKKKKKKKTWRDYLNLYDGNEYFAQIHFECMQSFKVQLIAQCVNKQRKNISNIKTKPQNKQINVLPKDCSQNNNEMKVKKKKMKKESDTLKTPQSPQQSNPLPAKIINIPYPSTMNSNPNPLPFNLPQIAFNAQTKQQQHQQHYAPQPIIKSLPASNTLPQYEHLTVSQPITASYPSQQINYNQAWYTHPQNSANTPQQQPPQQQYMPIYAAQTIHGYPYHHTLTAPHPQATAYYAAAAATSPSVIKANAPNNNAIYPQLIATKQGKDKFPSLIPNFDISKGSKPIYCDTVSSLSNTSNISNASCISSSHSVTSILSKTNTDKAKIQKLNKKPPNLSVIKKKELISSNGQWVVRQHLSGSARTDGFYSLAPSKKRKKFRHLGAANHRDSKHSNKRRRIFSQSQHMSNESLLLCKQKNIQFGKSSIHSWGVFALEDIASEEMVVEYIGEYIDEKIANLREKLYEKQGYDDYMFRVDDNLIIDATKKGNLARFINHSCDPNCYTRIVNVNNTLRVVIYSKMQIKAGEELTYDYKFPIEDDKIVCLCASKNCRGTLN